MSTAQLPLADDYFLLAHDEYMGKSRLNPSILGAGLAGALLGELMLARRIGIRVETCQIEVVEHRPPACPLAHAVLDQLEHHPDQRDVRLWLQFLGKSSYGRVAGRLIDNDIVASAIAGPPWRRFTVYPPRDINAAGHLFGRVARRANRGEQLEIQDLMLLALADATSLGGVLLQDVRNASRYQQFHLNALPLQVRCLIDSVRELLDAIALNRPR